MIRFVDTRDSAAVECEVRSIHAALFPGRDPAFVPRAFGWVLDSFAGRHPGYLALDTRYHDVEHTMQGTVCLAQLLAGRAAAGATPSLTADAFELGMVAILFHDTGYLKRRDDTEGTGAKYTVVHVQRSAAFAGEFLPARRYSAGDVTSIQSMIQCTGVGIDLGALPFRNELERTIGLALGTADLLGQMAAADYVDKLPVLYDEFHEAANYKAAPMPRSFMFESRDALIRGTPGFWTGFVKSKLDGDFEGVHRFLNEPYPDGPNPYVERIERNIARLPVAPASA